MTFISFKYGFVFVKTTKKAGTSIEVELSKIAGDDAVVTPVIPPVDRYVPRNYTSAEGTALFFAHIAPSAIRKQLGQSTFGNCENFA